MKKAWVVIIGLLIFFSILANIILFFSVSEMPFARSAFSGIASLVIEEVGLVIFIYSPLNDTYYFEKWENYTIDLNVSANFEVDKWWYNLTDLRHDIVVNESVFFDPNSTIEAVRWDNNLTVYANNSEGEIASKTVIFFVSVPNSAPILGYIDPEIYVCEGNSTSYDLNATDIDEDDLEFGLSPKYPSNPFDIKETGRINWTTEGAQIFSATLDKDDVGIYEETVSVSDGEYVDTNETNITVIEINNPPEVENIGVHTIWTKGENSIFYYEVQVGDVEDGDQTSGNFYFNLTFPGGEDLFNINQYGIMNYTSNGSDIGVYNMALCVTDLGIGNPHEKIEEECGQDGGNQTVCQSFSLTITDENRPPTITDWYPKNLTLNVGGTESLYFNITKYDPDWTIPDAYWYVDNVLREYDSGSSVDEFSYTFGCNISGQYKIKVEITDGLLNDSVEWTVNVGYVLCPLPEEPGPSGAGAGIVCVEKWLTGMWNVCQDALKSLLIGVLSGDDYRIVQETCLMNRWDEEYWGYQIRDVFDANNCNTTRFKPSEIRACFYVEKPSCFDGVKNCHDGLCELLIDCGGPCLPCPTCSDGIQNQGEEGIDCGGPCPWPCPPKPPLFRIEFKYILILILLILIIIIWWKIRKIIKIRKELKQIEKQGMIKR